MGRMSLSFCCTLYLLALLNAETEMFGGPPKYSNLASTEQKALPVSGGIGLWTGGDSEFNEPPPVMRPYHVFPMFDHVPVPLADMELFRPVPGRRHLPNTLSRLLVPQANPQRMLVSPVRNSHGVEVWCGYSKVSVRVNKRLLGFRSSPAFFYLGVCSASRSDNGFVYFHYDLNECDSSLTMVNGQIMYSNTLQYIPEPQGPVIRAVPLTLNIQCLYNRFHYSYKMGYLPVIRDRMFHKTFESRVKFAISVCNERWEMLEENESFMLGEPMYFEVSAAHISKHEKIFVDSCYATSSEDPDSTQKHSVIENYGCLQDSRRNGSLSRFIQRESNFVRFSADAVFLPQVTGTHFHLHCMVSVHNNAASPSAKSCTYNSIKQMWEELYADASVCACCEATCEVLTKSSLPHVTQSVVTSKSWILNKTEENFTHNEERVSTQDMKFKSARVIVEEVKYTEEIVTDPKEQIKTPDENEATDDADEEVEIIAGTEAALTVPEYQGDDPDRSGKAVFLWERMEKSNNTDTGIYDDVDEEVEIIAGTETALTVPDFQGDDPQHSKKEVFLEEHMEKSNDTDTGIGNDEDEEVISGTETAFTVSEFHGDDLHLSVKDVVLGKDMEKSTVTDSGNVESKLTRDTVGNYSVQFFVEHVKDIDDDNKSVPYEKQISNEEMSSDDSEENMQSMIQSQIMMDENMFLNSKQEPMEWNEDAH